MDPVHTLSHPAVPEPSFRPNTQSKQTPRAVQISDVPKSGAPEARLLHHIKCSEATLYPLSQWVKSGAERLGVFERMRFKEDANLG